MALILCLDSSTDICSVALSRDGELVALMESAGRDHAEKMGLMVDTLLRQAGLTASALDAVAVSSGPGSYTGLRIGVSLAKGLCYGAGIPLIGVGSLLSLAMLAREAHPGELLCPMIDARRMEVYLAVYSNDAPTLLTPVQARIIEPGTLEELSGGQPMALFGNGAAKCRDLLPDNVRIIEVESSARGMIVPAHAAFERGDFESTAYFEPAYLKDFVVTTRSKPLL